jgi:hypothetical protein
MVRALSFRLLLIAVMVWPVAGCGKDETARSGTPAGRQAEPPASRAMPKTTAVYRVVLKSTWTPTRHPIGYPKGAHFSGLIGASHNAKYRLFGVGRPPTPGLERLSEEEKHSPLDAEIRAAISAGNALEMFKTGALKNFRDSLVTTVRVDPAHPRVSLVAMIAPSPDWFTGAANVDLVENGAWVASRTLRLSAYDAGGDDGTTYLAPDRDANPKKPISRAAGRYFVKGGAPVPVATLRLIKQ